MEITEQNNFQQNPAISSSWPAIFYSKYLLFSSAIKLQACNLSYPFGNLFLLISFFSCSK